MKLEQKQGQVLHLTNAMKEALQLLAMPMGELEGYLAKCVEENPLLEYVEPEVVGRTIGDSETGPADISASYSLQEAYHRAFGEQASWDPFYNVSKQKSFAEYLLEQLGELSLPELSKERAKELLLVAGYIIESLEDKGFLEEPLGRLAVGLHKPLSLLQEALKLVQRLEPAGVGAKDVEESLLLQVERYYPDSPLLARLIREDMERLASKAYRELAEKYEVSEKIILKLAKQLQKLQPYPAAGYNDREITVYMMPEAVLDKNLELHFVRADNYRLKLNEQYQQLAKHSHDQELDSYVKKNLRLGNALLRALQEREKTLHRVISKLVERQRDFFTIGVVAQQSLTHKQLAKELGLHESTISRAVKDKYILTAKGPLKLAALFSQATGRQGEVSAQAVKARLVQLLRQEDGEHPLSDHELELHLQREGIRVARRTIAKYREALGIPTAAKRKTHK